MELLYHFEYTSGANPYVVNTKKRVNRIIERWQRVGVKVTEIEEQFYLVDDAEYEKIHGNYCK